MLQPQGPREFEPYRILQLQPHASHDVVVEAYWTLVARAKAHGNDAAMRALNAAYELLTSTERRSAYDREHGYGADEAPEQNQGKRAKDRRNGHQAPDHYRLLAVDREADPDVIEVAYRIAMRKASGYQPELVLRRERLTDAFHILSNGQLRAQYDASIGAVRAPAGQVVPPAPPDAAAPATAADAAPKPDEPLDPGAAAQPPSDAPRKKRGLGGLLRRHDAGGKPAATTPARISGPPAIQPVTDETARGQRLLELRPFGAEVLVGSMRMAPAPAPPPMAVLSIAGPAGEDRVPLPPRTVTIGSADENDIILPGRRVAGEQLRLWPHGDTFALRVTGHGPVRVGGVEPSLTVVLLEDGDVIELSEYRLTFHNTPRQ